MNQFRFYRIGTFVLIVLLLGAGFPAGAARVSAPIPLWPMGAPGETGNIGPEHDTSTPGKGLTGGKPVIRLGDVSVPAITIFRPSWFKANGAAVVVCPGGGYGILAYDLEGTEICKWFNSIGVTAVLLKYRVPTRPNDNAHLLPLQDAQRALRLVRYNAKAWKIDPQRVGLLGFSAGGHLTAHVDSTFDQRAYEPVDDADQISCRPDFAMLIYPAYLVSKGANTLAPDVKIGKQTPPSFLVQAEDDPLGIEGVTTYYLALKNAKVPAEIHLYPTGGHGYGLRPTRNLVSTWPKRVEDWLRTMGTLEKKKKPE